MSKTTKTELSPDNGAVIDTKWKLGPLGYHASAASPGGGNLSEGGLRLPEIVVYDHVGFKGAYARTNLSFHFLGDFWNDRISSVVVVNGVWRFYRGPGFYESFFTAAGPDDAVSSFQAISLT
jgi:hypothetical protein